MNQAVEFLTPEGELNVDGEFAEYAVTDAATLRGWYRDMAMIRRFDQEATALQRQGELALWVSLLGQEAAQIGSGSATQPRDYIFPSYREHGVALTRGLDLGHLLGMFRGVTHGGWDPRENNFHFYTLVLAAQTLHAVGYAMGIQRDQAAARAKAPKAVKDTAAVVTYFGDGASSEGDVHESMVFAASYNAPVVFFCQNNQWAISVPAAVQTKVPLAERARGYGFPGIRVDGNDIIAVHAVTQWALEQARNGRGPVLIEAFTYRRGAHTTADDPTKYRLAAEEKEWIAKDPLSRLETYLRAQGLVDQAFFDAVTQDGNEMATNVRRTLTTLPEPDLRESFASVYAERHPLIDEELAAFEHYEAGFEAARPEAS